MSKIDVYPKIKYDGPKSVYFPRYLLQTPCKSDKYYRNYQRKSYLYRRSFSHNPPLLLLFSHVIPCSVYIYKNSFFPMTIIDWNHLEEGLVRTETVDTHSFRKAVHHWGQILSQLSTRCINAERPRTCATSFIRIRTSTSAFSVVQTCNI